VIPAASTTTDAPLTDEILRVAHRAITQRVARSLYRALMLVIPFFTLLWYLSIPAPTIWNDLFAVIVALIAVIGISITSELIFPTILDDRGQIDEIKYILLYQRVKRMLIRQGYCRPATNLLPIHDPTDR
jgi:hypothetical protein